MDYEQFLIEKLIVSSPVGIEIDPDSINQILFPFQRAIVEWACHKGRCAVFADTGLGKTFIQLEWARLIGGTSLILAPLSVARQTVGEGRKIGVDVNYCRSQEDIIADQINITNYEMLSKFNPAVFRSVVCDESSILKSLNGKTRRKLLDMFSDTPYRLCCTATPAPNDQSEIGNHAEFLGICTMADMLAMFFVHDDQEWRIKGHATTAFYRWMSSWAMSVRMPSDIGFDDDGYVLPPLTINPVYVKTDVSPEGQLFFTGLKGIQDRSSVRKATIPERIEATANLINGSAEQWIVWCGLNDEANAISRKLNDARNVQGSDALDCKIENIQAFQDGQFRVLVTKPKVAGFGMNFQNCHNMVFLGMNDSWEGYYQCIRRCYRFGQTRPVNAYIVLSTIEQEIYRNVMNKEEVATRMSDELIRNVKDFEQEELHVKTQTKHDYQEETATGKSWTAMLGDSGLRLKEIPDDSIHLSVYSPPFADLYTYSASQHDLGNSRNWDEFFAHYSYVIREVLRVTMPGRLTAVHTADIPAMLVKDGFIGLRDFPGEVIRAYEGAGWIYHGRVTIDKNPQAQAIRTHAKALLFAQMEKDSSWSRPAVGDYMLIFRKPGDNPIPVRPVKNGELTRNDWIQWAHPIWFGINESDTLQYRSARENADEKHICPLQLGVIERCIRLWSNPGETVLSPFGGIGSEGYQAVRLGRKAIICELKQSYWKQAVANLGEAERQSTSMTLFDYADSLADGAE